MVISIDINSCQNGLHPSWVLAIIREDKILKQALDNRTSEFELGV